VKELPDEGDGSVKMVEWDEDFARGIVNPEFSGQRFPGSYDDMVDMRKLNDAELMRNLRERFMQNGPFCRCGITLVSMNVYRTPKNSPDLFGKGPPEYMLPCWLLQSLLHLHWFLP